MKYLMQKSYARFATVGAAAAISLGVTGCGKTVRTGDLDPQAIPPALAGCAESDRMQWLFRQPLAWTNKMIDVLFVVDTSDSLVAERSKIAAGIGALIQRLPSDADVQIGVMLAHGGASSYTGRLYSPRGVSKVLSTQKLSLAQIQSQLVQTLTNVVVDRDSANGEMMMYSFLQSMSQDRMAEIQSQGFYRSNAALSVIFVSDENDQCYPPELHGYSSFPDYAPSPGNSERTSYRKYCLDSKDELAITPEAVLAALQELKADHRFSVGAVTHVSPEGVPRDGGEDAIGHGLLELTQQAGLGLSVDIADANYAPLLSRLGDLSATTLDLQTRFELSGVGSKRQIVPESLHVEVDKRGVPFRFDSGNRLTELNQADAVGSGSVVQIDACTTSLP